MSHHRLIRVHALGRGWNSKISISWYCLWPQNGLSLLKISVEQKLPSGASTLLCVMAQLQQQQPHPQTRCNPQNKATYREDWNLCKKMLLFCQDLGLWGLESLRIQTTQKTNMDILMFSRYPKMELYRLSDTEVDFVHRLYAGNRDDEEKSL